MSEENKALARRYLEEVWDKGNVALIDELFTTDFVRHGPPAVEGEVRGPEGFKGLVSTYHAGFPDFQVTIDDMIAEGDRVVSRWTVRGTHQGELMGQRSYRQSGNLYWLPLRPHLRGQNRGRVGRLRHPPGDARNRWCAPTGVGHRVLTRRYSVAAFCRAEA